MDVATLQARRESLDADMRLAKQTIAAFNEQLENEKAQFHVLSGHHYEVGYQIECLIKEQEDARLAKEEADKLALESKPLKRA